MKRITKEICEAFIKDHYKSKSIFLVVFSIFALGALWFITKNIVIVSISAAVVLGAIIFVIYITNQNIKNANLDNFYLVEDVVVDLKKKRTHSKAGGSGHDYIYTFRDYGKYRIHKSVYPTVEISLRKKTDISHLYIEKLCLESCEKGDIYYLLIEKKKECAEIIKCFPKYNFDVEQEDFDYIDGKYYCKK